MLPLQWCLPIFCAGSLWLAWPHLAPLWGLVGACLPALPASLGGALGALLCAVGCAGSRHALACLDLPAASAVGKCKQCSVCAGPAPLVAAFGPHWAIVIPVRIISLEIVIPVGPKFNQQEVEQLIRNIN